jgi:L-fucose isomerase-like protein
MDMKNIPQVKIGLVAVSRDCFPIELSRSRRMKVAEACKAKNLPVTEIEVVIENENDVMKAVEQLEAAEVNSLVVYLGNFGPEGPLAILAESFFGPKMFVAAAEESSSTLGDGRGDAYCGMLNASYNAGLRGLPVYIPEYPVGTPDRIADLIEEFVPISRVVLGLAGLKIFSFGPRPQDFLACNAPIGPLYDLGVEIMENSELDLYDIFLKAKDDPSIPAIKKDMEKELGAGNTYPDLLDKLAQFEAALLKFAEDNLGASSFAAFADKCWPAFEEYFGFVPCYVNSRLASRGIPVSCEVDIYGALSEYMITCATAAPATLLDINNTVPQDMYDSNKSLFKGYKPTDLFMGFHCGNTASDCMANCSMKYQLIMHRLMESGKEPDITRGTLEGTIRPGEITLFRLQSTAFTELRSYVAEGEVIDIDPQSFGSIGVFAVKEMGRFYRHVLIQDNYPHHAGIAFGHAGKILFEALKMLGIEKISYNQPASLPFQTENPFV